MKLVIFLGILALAFSHNYIEKDDVIVLNETNLDQAIQEFSSGLFVKFYAAWCGHCKKVAPIFSDTSRILKKSNSTVYLAEIESDKSEEIKKKYKIAGYPTIKLFYKNRTVDYQFKGKMIDFINDQIQPFVQVMQSHDHLKSFLVNNTLAAVFFGNSSYTHFDIFESACRNLRTVPCVSLQDEDSAKLYGAEMNQFLIFKPFDEKIIVYTKEYDEMKIFIFLKYNSIPLVNELNPMISKFIFDEGTPGFILFRDNNSTFYDEILRKVALQAKEIAWYVYSQIETGLGKRLADHIGIKRDQLPCVWIVLPKRGEAQFHKFQMQGEINEENILQFINNFKTGQLFKNLEAEQKNTQSQQAQIKSQPIPVESMENKIRILVRQNFEQVAYDQSKDVFVKFYAPWCGHCKKLAPIWEQVASDLSHVESLIIAKIDATQNSVDGVSIKGYPTLILFPAGQKTKISYEGPRDLESLKKWIKENASIKFEFREEL